MMTNRIAFTALHTEEEPLLLGNVWDAHTAKLAENAGFKALGSSSHAIANVLGYEDGEQISFEELLFMIKRIVAVASVPVSVDFESGYSDDPRQVAQYVKQLSDMGIAGINLEDSVVKDGKRVLGDPALLAEKIRAIQSATDIFINARTDTFTTKHPEALEESITRSMIYEEAGANGIFVPLLESASDISIFTQRVRLPLNVFITPALPAYADLQRLGVKRISHGAKYYERLMNEAAEGLSRFYNGRSYPIILG